MGVVALAVVSAEKLGMSGRNVGEVRSRCVSLVWYVQDFAVNYEVEHTYHELFVLL